MAKKRGSKKSDSPNEYDVSPREFISAWESCETVDEVFEKFGGRMSKPIICARAAKYRKAGINLKLMRKRPARGLDVESLNELVEKIRSEQGVTDGDRTQDVKSLLEQMLKKMK